ncbi:MFS general substrate transporter [Pluteus cervinus]|uniref:MFS general substrate transporter n=1 Tax=Pluteus cervinus TaxID=181527 RepID=A0ACD3ATL7_9AGAR|nr:MFS general substrate transporter [Pluteus cervinus]
MLGLEGQTEQERAYRKRLHGWLSYAFASEVFVIVSLTLFLPICLEQFARDNGYLMPDKTIPCSSATPAPTANGTASEEPAQRCVVKLGWLWIDSASFSLYVYSISVALQALTVISMGGIADHPTYRKRILLAFGVGGASAAIAFLLLSSSSPLWFMSAFLGILANVGFGASVVAMNSYLPALAKDAPEVKQVEDEIFRVSEEEWPEDEPGGTGASHLDDDPEHDEEREEADAHAPLLAPPTLGSNSEAMRSSQRVISPKLDDLFKQYDDKVSHATSRISSLGIALGYGAGITLLLVALVPVTKLKGSTFALRLAIGLSGIWWAVFSIPAALWLPGKESPPHEEDLAGDEELGAANVERDDDFELTKEIAGAWKRLGRMLIWSEVKKLKNTFLYLLAWFLLSDGFTTITSTAILFGKTTLNMQPSALILIGVLTPLSGILGSLVWPMIQRTFGWSNLRVLIILVVMASFIPVYGCLGFLSVFRNGKVKFGGLTTQEEMFGLAVYFGSVYGAFQAYARAFYAELLPPGEEARWYGLFSITDKSSSFLGPLVVGLISDVTGNIRYAFFFLIFMIWVAVPILMSVNVEKGRKDAREYRDPLHQPE